MTNDQIDKHIEKINHAINKSLQPKTKADEELIEAGVRLVGNLLKNINDLAFCALEEEARRRNSQ